MQFWTHLSRKEALKGAIRIDQESVEEMPPGRGKEKLSQKIDIMLRAQEIEEKIAGIKAKIAASQKEMDKIQEKTFSEPDRIRQLLGKGNIPEANKNKILERYKTEEVGRKERFNALVIKNQRRETKLNKTLDELEDYKSQHNGSLPTSYLEPTFQIAADFVDSNGEHVYKRFSSSGHVLTGDPNLAYQDGVHLRYTRF